MSGHLQALGRGFNWLAGAAAVARIVDFGTIVILLFTLTREQVGVASLVVSIGMVVEAFNGLGTGDALTQARAVSRRSLDTLFWVVLGAALVVAGLVLLAAPWIATLYGDPGIAAFLVPIAVKQPLVAAAVIPLALLNRRLRFERIAIVSLAATLAAAATRLALVAAGAGAWSLVLGYAASGLYTLIGATIAQRFLPQPRFRFAEARALVRFGMRAVVSNAAEQAFKNVDYLLVGWFYGTASLAVYRVAFDIAMEPAMAVGTIVNRAALPVFARVATDRSRMSEALLWSCRRIAILVAPLATGLILAAAPLTSLLHDRRGHSYASAAVPLELLAAACLMRLVVNLLATAMTASGRPGAAAKLSTATLLLLSTGIFAAGLLFPKQDGLIAVSAVWLCIYPLLLAWGLRHAGRSWRIPPSDLLRAIGTPMLGAVALAACVLAIGLFFGQTGGVARLGLTAILLALLYAGLFREERRRPRPAA